MQTNSPDISLLDFDLLLDISGATPSATFTNHSTVINAANLQWVLELYSPSGTPIYQGNFDAPDVDGVAWAAPIVKNTGFPRPFGAMEWSSPNPYRAIVKVKDSNGNIFSEEKKIRLCAPAGWKKENKNMFGVGLVGIQAKCNIAKLWAEDRSSLTYQGITGTIDSKSFKLLFPADDTGTAPAPIEVTPFNTALIPITTSGPGYQYFYTAILDYDLGSNVTVKIKYIERRSFAVHCNIDLSPIACELEKLIQQIESGSCSNIKDAQRKMEIVSAKLHIATIGILYPQAGIDPFKIVDEIKELTGWQCECCPSGLAPLAAVGENVTAYEVVSDGGDIDGEAQIVGSTVQIILRDKSYTFTMCPGNESTAFTITPSVDGQNVNYCLMVNRSTLADEILTQFEGNASFKNRLNAMINVALSSGYVNVKPRCLKIAGAGDGETFTYSFATRAFVGAETLFIRFVQLVTSTTSPVDTNGVKMVSFLFDQTNAADLKTALDALGIGTWTAAYAGSVLTLTVTTTHNIDRIQSHFSTAAVKDDYVIPMTKSVSSSVGFKIEDVLQALIDFVCTTIINNITVGTGLSIKFLQAIGGAISTITINSSDNLTSFFQQLVSSHNQLVELVRNQSQPNCDTIKSLFVTEDTALEDSDLFLANINGKCMVVSPETIAKKVLDLAAKKAAVKDLFCVAVQSCTKPVCGAVGAMTLTYDAGASTLTAVITNTGAPQYKVAYRLVTDGKPPILGLEVIDAEVGVTTTHVWAGVSAGTYEAIVAAICADGSQSVDFLAQSASCIAPTIFNVAINGSNFDVTYGGLPANAAKVRIEIRYPNGGSYGANYAPTDPNTVAIPIPSGVYGDFVFVLKTVCNEAQAWYSAATAEVKINVPSPSVCPLVTAVVISDITDTEVTVEATKPVTGNVPGAYVLQLTPQNGGPLIRMISNTAGATVTWNVTGLLPNTRYGVEVISECKQGVGDPYFAGVFATAPSGVGTSHVTNDGTTDATDVAVLINGAIVHTTGPLAAGNDSAFNVANYVTVPVKVTICDAGAQQCTLTVGATTYNPSLIVGEDFYFENVTIDGNDIEINFTDEAP